MTDRTKIEWADATWNPVTGCSPVSDGCTNCYASRMVKRFPHLHGIEHGPDIGGDLNPADVPVPFSRVRFHPSRLDQPLCWKKPRRVFVCSMGDLFHEDVDEKWLCRVFVEMVSTMHHTFMILTKRPERMRIFMQENFDATQMILPNLWLGVTAENQEMADQRIPILLQTPAAKRFVSVEPMLGPVDLRTGEWASGLLRLSWLHGTAPIGRAECYRDRGLDWIICGPENGPGARPMDLAWARSLRDQCRVADVPFFMKTPKKGMLPDDLMIKEFPR